ncbi:MAG: ABC transporter substrate-binding protein [Azospirillaceae bacterium]
MRIPHSLATATAALAIAGGVTVSGGALAQDTDVTVALLRLTSSSPIFIAHEMGYFEEEGLNVELVFVDAAVAAPTAVVSGDADFAVTGATAGFYNQAGQGALTIIGAQSREEPGYQLVAYVAGNEAYENGLTSPEDLPGHSIGMTTVGSTFHYAMGALADLLGFDLEEVELVPLQGLGNMNTALIGGQVDAILTVVNIANQLEAEGSGHIIGWVADYTPWQLGVLLTSPDNVENNREMVEAFVRGYQRGATDYYNAFLANRDADGNLQPGEGYDETLAIMAEVLGQPAERVANGLPFIDPLGRLDVGNLYHQVEWWQSQGLVNADVNLDDFLDLTFIEGHFNLPE